MEKSFAEDDYVRCDIVTGRLYRCLTSLFQEFLEVQFSSVFGPLWISDIVNLADSACGKERDSLSALSQKRKEKGLILMDKTCIDVTIANALMLYTCYYLVSVPQYNGLSVTDMVDIIHKCENKPKTFYENDDAVSLRNKLIECIRKDVKVVLECQGKFKVEKDKVAKIRCDDFFKKIKQLVDNKNRLNSHMSTVNDPIASELEITNMIINLGDFLDYLDATWEYQMKEDFLLKYRKEVNTIRYLRTTTNFADVTRALSTVINTMPMERAETKTNNPNDGSKEERHKSDFKRCFSLLANANNHCAAYTALMVESDSLENPCATIMLAFMYYCGWASGHTVEEILMPISVISDPEEWLAMAEELKISNREQSAAYYIGHAMVNNAPSAFKMAGYLGVRLENYEVAKACFKYAGETDKTAKTIYEGMRAMPDESSFLKWAVAQNKKR